jgi:low affinity Fe/Cu permease
MVSLEAIYLAIFIQMTVNQNTQSLREVEVDIDEIQENIDEIQEDVDEIQEDVVEMTEEEKAAEVHKQNQVMLERIHHHLQGLMKDVEKLKS